MILPYRSYYFAFLRLTCILFPVFSFAQYFSIDTIKDESPYRSQFSFIFPHTTNKDHPEAANRIFTDLAKDVLNIEPGHQKRSLFENVWGSQEMDIAPVSDISYRVVNNDADFFSITISATGCGAYCENWTRYYTYESGTGRKIKLEEIYTDDGLEKILGLVNTLKLKRIQDKISDIDETIKANALSDEDKRDYKKAVNIYEQCQHSSNPREYIGFSLDKGQITIYQDYCLPHAIHFLDKVDYAFSFDIAAVKNYLSDYGKSLLKQ
jgi:hypothetical protein